MSHQAESRELMVRAEYLVMGEFMVLSSMDMDMSIMEAMVKVVWASHTVEQLVKVDMARPITLDLGRLPMVKVVRVMASRDLDAEQDQPRGQGLTPGRKSS